MTFFGNFDFRWPLMTSWHLSSLSWSQERHYDIPFTHFLSLLKFDLFSEFLTSGDLCWPRDPFFWKAYVKSVRLIYITSYFIKVRNSTFFRIFDLGWPLLTSWPLFSKSLRLERQIDIYYIIFYQSSKFDLFWGFLTAGDLFWPRVTFFQKACAETVILIYSLSYFLKVRNLTFFGDFWPSVTFFDLGWPFIRKLTPRPSFWYIV